MPDLSAHQLKPSRGSKGSATIPAMIAARYREKCVCLHGAMEKTPGTGGSNGRGERALGVREVSGTTCASALARTYVDM